MTELDVEALKRRFPRGLVRADTTVAIPVGEYRTIIAALEDREYLAEKVHTLSLSLGEVREDRERLREVIRQFLEAYTWPARNRNMLEVQRIALETAKAALEGHRG